MGIGVRVSSRAGLNESRDAMDLAAFGTAYVLVPFRLRNRLPHRTRRVFAMLRPIFPMAFRLPLDAASACLLRTTVSLAFARFREFSGAPPTTIVAGRGAVEGLGGLGGIVVGRLNLFLGALRLLLASDA